MAGYTVICVIIVGGPKFPVRCGVVSLLYILVDLLDVDHQLIFIISLVITYTPRCIGWNYHFIGVSFQIRCLGMKVYLMLRIIKPRENRRKSFKKLHYCECDGHHNRFVLLLVVLVISDHQPSRLCPCSLKISHLLSQFYL